MIKSLLKRRRAQDDTAETDDVVDGFDITTARLPGRSIIAFQKPGGQATALEVTERGAEIVKGLAAGVILSELEEVRNTEDVPPVVPLLGDGITSRAQAEAFIHSLDLLDGAEKQELVSALPR
ncbi:MAG: hypothetical protein AAF830_14835 [Pseudomonadota bacterium]